MAEARIAFESGAISRKYIKALGLERERNEMAFPLLLFFFLTTFARAYLIYL